MIRAAILLSAIALSAAAQTPPGAWLDAPPKQWNRVGRGIPRAPKIYQDLDEIPKMCRTRLREPMTAEEREVTSRGWMLFGLVSDHRGIVVVEGMANMDGMCRPDAYRNFVFENGMYAGTLSEKPMNARSDGASVAIEFHAAGKIWVEFTRYTDRDPSCCPSRLSEATYEVQHLSGKPVVVLSSVRTHPAER